LDIKDLIIIAGSIFFVLIVAHGLWVARRNRQNEIRMDIKASDMNDDAPLDLSLSQDFPNGGARVIRQALGEEGVETVSGVKPSDPPEQSHDALMTVVDDQHQAPNGHDSTPPRTDDLFETNDAPLVSENRAAEHKRSEKNASEKQGKPSREPTASTQNSAVRKEATPDDARRKNPQLEELLILGVMAQSGEPFGGDELVAALRGQGLKFGDMGIFHRTHGDSGERLFSVANAVEPGTFYL
jgi:cell division protein ZipA